MEQKNDKKMKAYKLALRAELAGLLGLTIAAGGFAITAGLGGAAAVITESSMNKIASRVADTDEYQAHIRTQRNELYAKLDAGEITYEEFHEAYKKMTDKYAVCDYSKTEQGSRNEDLVTTVDNYNKSIDCYKTLLGKGAGTFGAASAVCLGGYLGTSKIRKKLENELEIEEEQEEMAD